MKYIIKTVIMLFAIPFLFLGGLIAVLRTIWTVTFELAWEKGDEWYGDIMCELDEFMKK